MEEVNEEPYINRSYGVIPNAAESVYYEVID